MLKKNLGHVIREVNTDSIAWELQVEAGDILISINDEEIGDVFDYKYLLQDEYLEVLIRKQNGEEWLLEIDKELEEDLGIEFDTGLMSSYQSCCNRCIFCFIDQMPPGMRDTLYFKDDDARLSFLQGNYITLTNMKQKDIDRIIRMHLAPVNISIHTTNPELRCKMLHNRFAGEKLKFLEDLYHGQIEMNGQIVLCKNINDGEELNRTIDDLSAYLPFMRSVSVVPAGITRYREGLYPLELYNKEEARDVIDMIESRQHEFYEKYGLHFIHASDEWYITAQRDFPEEERYDGYIQLENGVGMMRIFMDEFAEALEAEVRDPGYEEKKGCISRTLTIATGVLAYPVIIDFASRIMEAFPGVIVNVCCIRNDFFGEAITVSGLITGQDLIKQLQERKEKGECLGDVLLIPSNMLRTGEQVFLDDVTVSDVEEALEMKLAAVEAGGSDFMEAVLGSDYKVDRDNGNFAYIKAYKEAYTMAIPKIQERE